MNQQEKNAIRARASRGLFPRPGMVDEHIERTETIDRVYANLNKLAALSAHSEGLVKEIYTDLIKWTELMQKLLQGEEV